MDNTFIMRQLINEMSQSTILHDIRPPSDDVRTVGSSNFTNYEIIGNSTMNIHDIYGGVNTSTSEQERVRSLATKISSPDGYYSRIIVDTYGSVLEGQHRLEALKLLGILDVPVFVIKDKTGDLPEIEMTDAINAAGNIHYDHVNQIISQISDMLDDVGSAKNVIDEYEFPKGFEKYFIAALAVLDKNITQPS